MPPARQQLADAVRVLSMDAVQQANSGHPGMPMGMADIIEVLWRQHLRHDPNCPDWPDRDRFVLSNGHGCMLLYAALHLSGYALSMEDLRQFRQLHSRTPGHPEYGCTPGVEATTGPLGQGLANAVGMAIAERTLAARFNRPGHRIINHRTWFFAGDGCLMEGISHEACSLAGTLGLGKLTGIFDSNKVSIDGDVRGWFTEDVAQRFRAYGWQVLDNIDGHDASQLDAAFAAARQQTGQPSLLICDTTIARGAPGKEGSAASHGAPLGEQEVQQARATLGWPHAPFVMPAEYYAAWDARAQGARLHAEWQQGLAAYAREFPELAQELQRRWRAELPDDWRATSRQHIHQCAQDSSAMATRKASQNALNAYAAVLPELLGGSADLSGSNLTRTQRCQTQSREQPGGNYIHYGVREFAMAAIGNGLALHGGFIPYSGTFLVFSDYARNALRMAALMGVRNIFVFTHDSIGLGEDGPTHQAVEHAASLRLIPNLTVWRPADAPETAVAWQQALERRDGPSALLLTRQSVAHIVRDDTQLACMNRGGYVLDRGGNTPELILIATGSELSLAIEAGRALSARGHATRVVSMPSTEVFDAQPAEYREQVLPAACRRRLAVEAGIGSYWRRYVGLDGATLGLDSFGASAPGAVLYSHFRITAEALVARAEQLLRETAA